MRILNVMTLMLIFFSIAQAQDTSPAVDFFMHGRFYDTFLRDHYRFEEPKPLRIEYWYVNWVNSSEKANEYRDYLHLEGLFPVFRGKSLVIDIPFRFTHTEIWAEAGSASFGSSISVLEPHLITRWIMTDRLRSIIGWEYNLNGDGENFGRANGRKICLLKTFLSYYLHPQLNLSAGVNFDRYYYDPGVSFEESDTFDTFKLSDHLYCRPSIMMNWHPNDGFTVLLGIPGAGIHLAIGDVLKAEARASIDREYEIALRTALRLELLGRANVTLRFLNTPYVEIPIEKRKLQGYEPVVERLYYTDKSIVFELGRELNPAAIASLGLRYNHGGDLELKDKNYKNAIKLDAKPYFAIGATFTINLEALTGAR